MTGPPDDPTQAVPTAAMLGGRYRLDGLVGRGGTAEVWRATDTSLDRVVALKLVTVAHDDSSARAADEARTLARLSHPCLVQVYDAGTDTSGRPWVVMEYVDGQTLADAIRRGPLSLRRVTEVGIAVADALEHVHSQGLVHRDVKPANVLLGRGGSIKLTDFGIARLVDAARVTSTGLMVGTASYLAPEQVTGQPVGPSVDVYALGLLLLETLTGQREYDGPPVEAAMARLHREPVLPASLPAGWSSLLAAMTAREPTDRPTAGQVAVALRGLLSGESTVALPAATTFLPVVPAPSVTTGQLPVAAPRRSRKGLLVGLGLLLVALVAGGVVASQSGSTATPRTVNPVSNDLPAQLKADLDSFVKQVEGR